MCRGYYGRAVLAGYNWDGSKLNQVWIFDTQDPAHPEKSDQRLFKLGLARSKDGVKFTRHSRDPVFSFGDDIHSVVTAAILKNPDGSVKWRSISFSQNAGPVMNAFRLACFLEGINTTERDCKGGSFKPAVTHHRSATLCCKALRITANPKLKREEFPETDVWCPTTDLGTWVMRQGRTITITGNSLEGGEKPDVLVQGHYHVNGFWNERNVHVVTLPGFQDQTIFGRKKRLRFEVGGAILEFKVNSAGAITRCRCEFNMFFNRGYYKAFLRSDRKLLKGHLRLTV